ncbi:hypothetical protein [Deinococcus radiotolerans]|uniref:Uncharacterized protein n=1 Tax=Deinococcus radiotolerans TaxID=1309407 RepID=A0ABQ2FQ25_9DEIO|nr:hypothetical protein [Deinococcus radiotolerans]GGL15685.1 hypothetical protein GCM10010844_38280 [Deinococcus radiotolerans]
MSDLPTAAQARILSENRRALRTEGEVMRLRTRISNALERGQTSIQVQPRLSPDARRRLEALGYTVTTYVPTQQETGCEPHDTVRW